MKSGFFFLQTLSAEIATLLRMFGFECISADKIYEYDNKKTYLKFIFKSESELNKDLDGQAIIIYAQNILNNKTNEQFKKAEKLLNTETKKQINDCITFLKVYRVLEERMENNTYLEVHIKRHGKLWKIPNMGKDWEKLKKKFNIKGIKTHKDHEKSI